MAVSASQVKELRDITGAGIMECKKALVETNGNIEEAVDLMRKNGQAKAAKKSARIAAEGLIYIASSADGKQASMVEVNCETDFVAREAEFSEFVQKVAEVALANSCNDVAAVSALEIASGKTVEQRREELVAKIGENIQIRRVETITSEAGTIGAYIHGNRIGVMVDLNGEAELAKHLAMHVAAAKPDFVRGEDVSEDVINKEKEIFSAQALASGKPAEIVEKMVTGRIKKFLGEISLYGQSFVMDPSKTVEDVLKEAGASVNRFVRYEAGEGIEKKVDNFVEEVKAQAKG
jgi:elongation factor Ts